MPDPSPVPGEIGDLAEMVAGLRAANARLRELLAERDELIAELRVQVAGAGELREQVEQLRREVADLAARVRQNSKNSSRPPPSDGLASRPRGRCGSRAAAGPAGRRGSRARR